MAEIVVPAFRPRTDTPVVKVADIAYLRFTRRDLRQARRYFQDFGLVLSAETDRSLYFRGVYGAHHILIIEKGRHDSFSGVGFRVQSLADLEILAQAHEVAVDNVGEPGGGRCVRLTDPSGMRVEIVYGMQQLPELPSRQPRSLNFPGTKHRINRPQPAVAGPPDVFRLGHVVLQRQEFVTNASWYIKNFGLIASDVEILPESRQPVLAFMRCDRGAEPADHHTLVIASGPDDIYDHAAFETLDLDAVALGGEWLQRQGWVQNWGVGRHVLGSQLFNYHFDPAGFSIEHYADGDVFDADYPTRYHETGKSGLYQWGPDLPPHFIDARPSIKMLRAVLRGLKSRPEFKLTQLAAIKKAFDVPPRPWAGKKIRIPKSG